MAGPPHGAEVAVGLGEEGVRRVVLGDAAAVEDTNAVEAADVLQPMGVEQHGAAEAKQGGHHLRSREIAGGWGEVAGGVAEITAEVARDRAVDGRGIGRK